MKVLFVGLGSIGKRHLKNIKKLEPGTIFHVLKPNPVTGDLKEDVEAYFSKADQIQDVYDFILICNPTAEHLKTLEIVNRYSEYFFIEKPIHGNPDYPIENLNIDWSKRYYIAAPLRYHAVFKAIKSKNLDSVISARAICSSYLPNWRAESDYRNSYSANKNQGGGVSTDLIHEMDYLVELFGYPSQVISYMNKFSNLEIDCEDLALYWLVYQDKVIEVHLDYFGHKSQRSLELLTNFGWIKADYLTHEIIVENGVDKQIEHIDVNDMYLEEMDYFIKTLKDKSYYDNDLEHSWEILKLTKGKY